MSGEAAKERATPFRPNPNYLRISVLVTKRKASSNSEGFRDLQIYHVFVANRFHCHPFAWPFHCGYVKGAPLSECQTSHIATTEHVGFYVVIMTLD